MTTPSGHQSAWMTRLAKLKATEKERQEKAHEDEKWAANAHPAKRDERGEAIVYFQPGPVAGRFVGHHFILSEAMKEDAAPREVGYVILAPIDNSTIELQKICIYFADAGRGYARAALRELIFQARMSGASAIVGRVAPYYRADTPEGRREERARLRRIYEQAGFSVDYDGEVDALRKDLTV